MLAFLSAAGYVLMAGALLGLVATRSLFSPAPVVIAVQAAAAGLMIWARVTLGRRSFHATAGPTAGRLITIGPYHFIRHPIYTSACLFGWAGALAHPSPSSLTLASLLLAGALVRIAAEERLLLLKYPEYRDYSRRTKRMIPRLF
jgi:protein-S-isoprenylcysteine O-methyltransferase Ste14